MKRSTLVFWTLFVAIVIFFGAPFGLLYYFDSERVNQLTEQEKRIVYSENEKNISIIRKQITENLSKVNSTVDSISPAEITKKYSSITENKIIKNYSYSQKKTLQAITKEFLSKIGGTEDEVALLSVNGKVYETNKPALKNVDFTSNQK